MLLQLNILNFALIESLTLNFDKGFNVLSGETGAGKSILIDAINYVLGGKFSKDLIRTGTDRTYVEAVFTIENEKTKDILKEMEIDFDELVIISRETFQSGRSIAKVNGKSLILSNIKVISETLLNIHGQHENQYLLDSFNHIFYLDYYGHNKMKKLLEEYKRDYEKLKTINNRIASLKGGSEDREKLIDFLRYQIDEIEKAKLSESEEKELDERYSILTNSEKINKSLSCCYDIIYNGQEDYPSLYHSLNIAIRELKSVEKHMEGIQNISKQLEECYYNIEQSSQEIRSLLDKIYFDENELELINSRIFQIGTYKKKYGKTIKDILDYKKQIEAQYEDMINSNEIIERLKKEKDEVIKGLKSQIDLLHEERVSIARELEVKVKEELDYVGLEKSIFKIEVKASDSFNELGGDNVLFYISTNPGEPLKPLEKVVSGGELSRIMLALKSVFVDKDSIPSIVFDEIDTGISGRIAQSVAEKMYLLSNKHQVFCVTHLSQIACMSDIHYIIYKETEDNKTYTFVKKMDEEEKQIEIARMLGGVEVTQLTIDHSKELIKMANKKKEELLNNIG